MAILVSGGDRQPAAHQFEKERFGVEERWDISPNRSHIGESKFIAFTG
jgi:hypothetical protein